MKKKPGEWYFTLCVNIFDSAQIQISHFLRCEHNTEDVDFVFNVFPTCQAAERAAKQICEAVGADYEEVVK